MRSVFSDEKKLSIATLSQTFPDQLQRAPLEAAMAGRRVSSHVNLKFAA
jgi:hypothetical protein